MTAQNQDDLPSLDALKQKIDAHAEQEENSPSAKERASRSRISGLAFRMGVDLVSAIGVSIVIGVWLDGYFDSSPLCFILLFLLGCIAGFRMMMETNRRAQLEFAKHK